MTTNTTSKWVAAQAEAAVQRAKSKWGAAWVMLSSEQQRGAIALEVMSVAMSQDEDCSTSAAKLADVFRAAVES